MFENFESSGIAFERKNLKIKRVWKELPIHATSVRVIGYFWLHPHFYPQHKVFTGPFFHMKIGALLSL